MDLAQTFVFDLGWIFFVAWAIVLAALGVIAFGRELVSSTESDTAEKRSA
jgi:hypothetical protein